MHSYRHLCIMTTNGHGAFKDYMAYKMAGGTLCVLLESEDINVPICTNYNILVAECIICMALMTWEMVDLGGKV